MLMVPQPREMFYFNILILVENTLILSQIEIRKNLIITHLVQR